MCYQCRLIQLHSSKPWFHLACSCCTCHPIGIGTGTRPFKFRRSSYPYISCVTCFWLSCRSFPQLQGKARTRNCHTGYLIFFALVVSKLLIEMIDPHLLKKSHPVGSMMVSLIGITYWYIWSVWLPKRKGYRLEREWVIQKDGISRYVFRRVARTVSLHPT